MNHRILKHHLPWFCLLSGALLAVIVALHIGKMHNAAQETLNSSTRAYGKSVSADNIAVSRPFHDIKAFYYSSVQNGQRLFDIQADRFSVRKMKIGFIRCALMKEVLLERTQINFYQPPVQNRTNADAAPQNRVNPRHRIDLKAILAPDFMDKFGIRSTAKVLLRPVVLCIKTQAGQPLVTIRAAHADIDLKGRKLVFQDQASIIAGNKKLIADRIKVVSEYGDLIALNGVLSGTGQKTATKAAFLKTNIFLTRITQGEKGEL